MNTDTRKSEPRKTRIVFLSVESFPRDMCARFRDVADGSSLVGGGGFEPP